MNIKILASGSDGNVALVNDSFLIDCGMTYSWTINKLKHILPSAILVTHEHNDHAKAVPQFLKRFIDIYMTRGTANALGLDDNFCLRIIRPGSIFQIGDVEILPFLTLHDAAEPVGFILRDDFERVLFLTDTGKLPRFNGYFDKIFIEANFSTATLLNSDTNYALKQRILANHLSIDKVKNFLAQQPQAQVQLLHQSQKHLKEVSHYVNRF